MTLNRWDIKPIIKFNGGIGAILCNHCGKIVKTNLSKEECEGKTPIVFCNDRCRNDYYTLNFPII